VFAVKANMGRARRRGDAGRTARALWLVCFGFGAAALAHFAGAHATRTAPVAPPLRVTVCPIAGLAVAARLVVVAPAAGSVIVRYGADRLHATGGARFTMPPGGTLATALVGLRPAATTHVEVVAHFVDGTASSSGDRTVTTPSLEPDVPESLHVTVNDGSASGVVMLSLNRDHERGLAVIVDRRGRVLWYRHCGGGAFAFVRTPDGNLILHQMDARSFEELALDGTLLHTWTDAESVSGADGHDFQLLPDGNALLFGAETHRVDSRTRFAAGGVENAVRWDDTVSEVTRAGKTVWRWSSYGHVGEDEITADPSEPLDPKDYEVVHANSIEPLRDGTLLLSFRNLSTVAKLERATGRILWRLGGTRSDFHFVGDELGGFSRQHDARLVGPGRVLLYDDGNLHSPPESRAVEYQLDEAAHTATMVWEHRRTPPMFGRISGSVERLPDGHTLISWGPRGVVSEVDTQSKTVWELDVPRAGVYRARSVSVVGGP
jgi:hypothetical protein